MTPRKRNKLIVGSVLFFISLFLIIFTNDSSKLSSPFVSTNNKEQIKGATEVDSVEEINSETPTENSNDPIVEEVQEPQVEASEEDSNLYRVVKVVDGDTIDVEIDGKVERLRLIGIDTPETVDPRKPVQCFGKAASDKAKELLTGQYVGLESDMTQGDRDKYKRLLRYVFLPDGSNFNLYMILEGFAHEYTYDSAYNYQAEFKQGEIDARSNNKGLWNPDTCNGNK